MAKHVLVIRDTMVDEIIQFLDEMDINGQLIPAVFGPQV